MKVTEAFCDYPDHLTQVIELWNPRRRSPNRFVQLLDVIHEMHVVGAAEDHHAFRGGYSFEDLVHAVIRQECVASPTAAARMREKDDRANSSCCSWTPNVAREAAVADGVERLHAPLGNRESARDKR